MHCSIDGRRAITCQTRGRHGFRNGARRRTRRPSMGQANLAPMALYKIWAKANEARTSASTRNRWITVFRALERFNGGKDVLAFTEEGRPQMARRAAR